MRRLDRGRIATGVTLALLVLVALWARMQYITILGGTGHYVEWALENYYGGITPAYLWHARSLADGLGYYGYPCATPDWTPRELFPMLSCGSYISPLLYPPGYALLLAAMLSVGTESLGTLRLFQASIDALGVPIIYFLLRAIGTQRSLALGAGALYAATPLWAAGSTLLLAESLSPVTLLALMAALVLATRCDRAAAWITSGACIGMAALVRPDFLLFIGFAMGWIIVLTARSRKVHAGLLALAGWGMMIGAWGLHNKTVHGEWVFTSTGGGSGLYQGLGAVPNAHGYVISDTRTSDMLRARGLEWGTADADRFLKQEYLRAWREHPGHVLATIGERWKGIVFTSEVLRPDTMPGLRTAFDRYGLLLTLLAMLVYRRNRLALLVLATPLAYALLSIGLVHWEPRYVRYVPLSYLFAAVLLASAALAAVERRSRVGGVLLGATLLAAAVGYSAQALGSLRWEATAARIASGLAEQHARGGLVLAQRAPWTSSNLGTLSNRDDGVHFFTGAEPFSSQAVTPLPVSENAVGFMINFELQIARGGAAIGLLDGAGKWLYLRARSEPGAFLGDIRVAARPGEQLTLVVANHNPAGVSEFTLRRLDVFHENMSPDDRR